MIRNILLVEPRSPDVNIFSRFQAPRMGLAILATLARQAGYDVKVIFQEKVALECRHILWADLVGFSITTSTAPEGYRLARMVRAVLSRRGTRAPIVFGGVHATFRPDEVMEVADYVFRGEADTTWVPFLRRVESGLADGTSLADIPGLSWRSGGLIVHNPPAASRVDMDAVPTPDWTLFEGHRRGAVGSYGAVMTSRGCPHSCSFCSVTPMLGRAYRMRSVDQVMQDLAAISQRHVFFYDDNFAANPRRTKDLLRRIIAERGRTHHVRTFSAQVRADTARDPEILDLMAEAGFNHLYIGFESVNPATLQAYKKGQSVADIETAVREIHLRRIAIHGMFVVGSDADTAEVFHATAAFAKRMRLETVQFLILTPLPGSVTYHELEDARRIVNHDWSLFDTLNAVFLPARMTPYELQVGAFKAMRSFYSPWEALKWAARGKLAFAGLRMWGWATLANWEWRHRKHLRSMRADSREMFLPVGVRETCRRVGNLVNAPVANAVD